MSGYWKQCAGWVTALKHRYWYDPLVKSEVNVILLQLTFACSLFIIAAVFYNYIYQDILKTVIGGIIKGISSGKSDGNYITDALNIIKSNRFILFAFITFVLTVGFTFTMAKVILRPVREAINTQKRFISDIAHELRTPLSVLRTNSEVSLMSDELDQETRGLILSNVEEIDRMSQIINNLLSLKNLTHPERVKFENVDIGPVVDLAVNELKELAEKKQLEITIKKVTPHSVWGNVVAVEQIVVNLLKNAINYTNDGGQINIRIGPDYIGNVLLHIEDTGMGISKADLLHIFEPFYRAERSRNKKRGSSGLGLTIVSELVKMHSGRITIKSAENRGTVAIVTLPFSKHSMDSEKTRIDLSQLNEISVNFNKK